MASRLSQARGVLGVLAALRRAGMIAPMRPDRYLKMAAAMRREGIGITVGFASAAQRCPDRPVLKQHVRENLANYNVPREIAVLEVLPRGSAGKILRAELQSRVSG